MRKRSALDYLLAGVLIVLLILNTLSVFEVIHISNAFSSLMLSLTLLVCALSTYRSGYKKNAYFIIISACFTGVVSIIQLFV